MSSNKIYKNLSLNLYGFTLVELIVVIAIASVIITSIVIQQSNWNDRLAVNTQSYELALMVRQAQIYGLGVRGNISGSGDKFNVGYGVNVDMANPTQYIFFVDSNNNKRLDSGEALETKVLSRGVSLSEICGNTCATSGQVNVTFFRPEPNATVVFVGGLSGSSVTVKMRSPKGAIYSVLVESNGQVSVIK